VIKKLFICLIAFCSPTIAQTSDTLKTDRLGIIGSFDLACNFGDKVLNPGLGRKLSLGVSLTNKKRQFIGFIAIGLKGFKIDLYPSTFRESFVNDVKENYSPINGLSEDSLIGAVMNNNPNGNLWGTYAQYLEVGFILNKRLRPSFSFYAGSEDFLLHDNGFTKYEDPEHGDIHYVSMTTSFYEFKVGCAVPLKKLTDKPFCINANIGYKWVNYGVLQFKDTPLSAYTNGSLQNKYNVCGKLTASISIIIWSNWNRDNDSIWRE
jgi:hypothetical protein